MKFATALKGSLIASAIILAAIFLAFSVYAGIVISSSQINFDSASLSALNSHTSFYDKNNTLLAEASASGNLKISLSELPDYTKEAFLSIEDKEFYKHKGVNLKRIVSAGIKNVLSGYSKEGASTISQQLIKNTHLTNEKTIKRKIKEGYLALKLERAFSKDEILETYLNSIYFGSSAYGIEQASLVFFNKSARNLTLSESATLAGLIKSPQYYSPASNSENAEKRRNVVLNEMLKDGKITKTQYEEAKKVSIKTKEPTQIKYQSYFKAATAEAMEILKLSERDLANYRFKIYTNLCEDAQKAADDAYKTADKPQTAIVILNEGGGVCAVMANNKIDLYNLKRPGGSILKPVLVYAPALESGKISVATKILDEQTNFNGYEPRNVSDQYHGWVSVRKSLSDSLNIPAVKILNYNGIENGKAFAKKLGIEFEPEDKHLAIALGGMKYGVNPIKIAGAYSSFANGGNYIQPHFIRKITDINGKVVYESNIKPKKIFGDDTAFLVSDCLKDSAQSGTARRLADLPFSVASKTGTAGVQNSSMNTDAWNVSFTPQHTVCVWTGNATGDNKKNLAPNENGGSIATDICKTALLNLYKNKKPQDFLRPDNIVTAQLDKKDYDNNKIRLASPFTQERFTVSEIFASKFAPHEISNNFVEIPAPALSGKLTDEGVKLEFSGEEIYSYSLYKNANDKDVLIKTFKNPKEKITFFDASDTQTSVSYYLVAYYENTETNHITQSKPSNAVKFFVRSDSKQQEITISPLRRITSNWFG